MVTPMLQMCHLVYIASKVLAGLGAHHVGGEEEVGAAVTLTDHGVVAGVGTDEIVLLRLTYVRAASACGQWDAAQQQLRACLFVPTCDRCNDFDSVFYYTHVVMI